MTEPVLHFWDRLTEDVEFGRLELKADNVLVRIDADQGELPRGALLVVPGNVKRTEAVGLLGTVVAVGPGHYPERLTMPGRKPNRGHWPTSPVVFGPFIPTEVKVGDRVVLESQLSGDDWPLRSGPHRLVREAEILAVIEYEEQDGLIELGAA